MTLQISLTFEESQNRLDPDFCRMHNSQSSAGDLKLSDEAKDEANVVISSF